MLVHLIRSLLNVKAHSFRCHKCRVQCHMVKHFLLRLWVYVTTYTEREIVGNFAFSQVGRL